MRKVLLALALIFVAFASCRKDTTGPEPTSGEVSTSPVVFVANEVPYPDLSDYNFFGEDMAMLEPVEGVLPYTVITPLFSDYAKKSRFVWMPDGVSATYAGDHRVLDFPDRTVFIKNFYYDNVAPSGARRLVETRLLFRKNGQWAFANYVWNDAQTEALLDLGGSFTPISYTDDAGNLRFVNYRIPSQAECFTCHKENDLPIPIGPKPQNLNALHPYSDGEMNQLDKWIEVGYLENTLPPAIETTVRWDDATQDLTERVRAYVDMNCAHCHAEAHHCDYRPMRFAWNETADPINLGVCVPPDDPISPLLTHVVSAGNPERSMLYYRLNSTDEAERMPLLGRTVVHAESVALIREWIESLTPPCE